MAQEIVVPRLGWSMDEGTFVEWLKRDGDFVRAGEPLFVLEGEKAAQDIEAVASGILRITPDAPLPGSTVAVGAVLGYLVEAGESNPWERRQIEPAAPAAAASPGSLTGHGVNIASAPTRSRRNGGPTISPRARRAASELGIDWTHIAGSGRTGRIRERDVRAAADAVRGGTPALPRGRIEALSPLRRTVATRMLAGVRGAAPVTLTTKADASKLVAWRSRLKAAGVSPLPSYTHLFVMLAAAALRAHPRLNAVWHGDRLLVADEINIGVAVDSEAGLFVPVIHDVPALGLGELCTRANALFEQARQRRLTPEHMSRGTFTITNLGMYGIDAFTPILNPPQCAVLGLGRIVREPAVDGDKIVVRDAITLSLTFDHRAIDGGPAARFLDALRRMVEEPESWLTD